MLLIWKTFYYPYIVNNLLIANIFWMIPDFEKSGNLPPGIYTVTIEEFEEHYVNNIKRRELYNGLRRVINDLKDIGCKTIYVDGSYVTNSRFPKDIDVCWEHRGISTGIAKSKKPNIFNGMSKEIYNCDLYPAYHIESGSEIFFIDFFKRDKSSGLEKGIIRIDI